MSVSPKAVTSPRRGEAVVLSAPVVNWGRRQWLGLMAAAGLLAWLPGCGAGSGGASRSGKKKVLTTFTILADMAREVAGDAAEVESLIPPGAEVHGYEPTPRDVMKAQFADLVLWNGLNFEAWFEKFFASVRHVPSVVVSEGITPLSITSGPYDGKPNPHAWMSPANAVVYVENIRRALVQVDPENEATYNDNAAAYTEKLRAVDETLKQRLAQLPESRRWLATSEGAFSYLCRDSGLQELFLWPTNADSMGTPQQVKRVIDAMREHRIPAIFSESTVSDKPARQVAAETGAAYGGVLYVDSLTTEDGPAPTFLKMLEHNVETITRALTQP